MPPTLPKPKSATPGRTPAEALFAAALVVGAVLFLAGLLRYESWEARDVLERWSLAYVAFMFGCCVTAVVVVALVWHRLHRTAAASPLRRAPVRVLSICVLLWGASYLLAALDDRSAAGRIQMLSIFGSTYPPTVVLDWLAGAGAVVAFGLGAAQRLSARWHNVALVIGALAAALLVFEAVARGRALVIPQTQGFPTYSEALWWRRHVSTNHAGYRDIEHAPRRATGERAVLVVGDSVAFGSGVEAIGDRFGEHLAARLSTGAGRWVAVSAARPDTHTLQHLEALRRMLAIKPDLVLLLYVFNDIDYLAPVTPRPGLLRQGGWATISPARLLFLNSYLFQEVYVRWRKVRIVLEGVGTQSDPYDDPVLLARHVQDLGRFIGVARDAGAPAVIVPFDFTVLAGEAPRRRYEHFVAAVQAQQLPVCSIKLAFAGYETTQLRVNALDGHPNALAHRLAAEAAAPCVARATGASLPTP